MLTSYKFRMYPNSTQQKELSRQLDICRKAYNQLLSTISDRKEKDLKVNKTLTENQLPKWKEDRPEHREVYSKVLQMVNNQIWDNIKGLAILKQNGNRIGRLRYKTSSNSLKTSKHQRLDYLHKVSTYYIRNYDRIAIEDLNIGDMVQHNNHRYSQSMNKHILDASWRTFFDMLDYKAERAGRKVRKVDPKGTSKRCSLCSTKVEKNYQIVNMSARILIVDLLQIVITMHRWTYSILRIIGKVQDKMIGVRD